MQIFAKTFVNTNKNRIFALVFAYIWANGGCRDDCTPFVFFISLSQISLSPISLFSSLYFQLFPVNLKSIPYEY